MLFEFLQKTKSLIFESKFLILIHFTSMQTSTSRGYTKSDSRSNKLNVSTSSHSTSNKSRTVTTVKSAATSSNSKMRSSQNNTSGTTPRRPRSYRDAYAFNSRSQSISPSRALASLTLLKSSLKVQDALRE